jgi:hypothetical protein
VVKQKVQAWQSDDFEHEKTMREDLHLGMTSELIYRLKAAN